MDPMLQRSAIDLPTGAEKSERVRAMFDAISPRYDLVNRVIALGMDSGWRRRAVRSLELTPGELVLDVACGTGDLCREAQKARLRAVGFDFSLQMLRNARTTAPLVAADALKLPVRDAEADGLTCGFALRNLVDLKEFFNESARVLRPGGRFAFIEVGQPRSRPVKLGHSLYFNKIVPLIGRILSDREAYSYLPRSVAYLPAWEEIKAMLEAAGFEGVRRDELSLGAAQLITGRRS